MAPVENGIEVGGKTLGQLAFEAYCAAVGGQTYDGKPIPGWDELHGDRLKVQGGWHAAAGEVARQVRASDLSERAFNEAYSPRVKDFRESRQTRWQPLVDPVQPVGEPEPEFGAPIGRGEPPTGETVPVDVEPDDEDQPVECDDPTCTRREADHWGQIAPATNPAPRKPTAAASTE